METQQQNIPLQAAADVIKGVYANNMQASHTKEEFYLDFLNMSYFPNAATLVSKVIVSPGHFKRIVAALNDNLKMYEQKFGVIDSPKPENSQVSSESSKFGF